MRNSHYLLMHSETCDILMLSEKGREGDRMKRLKWIIPILLLLAAVLIGYPGFEKEYVFLRLDSDGTETHLAVDEDGNPVRLRPKYGDSDFIKYRTGDILRAVPLQIQEIYPANVIYLTCRKAGHTDVLPVDEDLQDFFDAFGYKIIE